MNKGNPHFANVSQWSRFLQNGAEACMNSDGPCAPHLPRLKSPTFFDGVLQHITSCLFTTTRSQALFLPLSCYQQLHASEETNVSEGCPFLLDVRGTSHLYTANTSTYLDWTEYKVKMH